MMSLPKFVEPSPSTEQLRAEQQRLRIQADKMLEQTGLHKTLTSYGQLEPIGGSYAYGLMVYPDIDLAILDEAVTADRFGDMVAEFVKSPFVRKVTTVNNVDFSSPRPGQPQGYWLGLEVPFENEKWGIDCWIQKKNWVAADIDHYASLLSNLGEPQRDAILHIKYQLIFRGLYGKVYTSADVYDAVMNSGILTVEDFLSSHAS